MSGQFTSDEVRRALANPVYTGMGSFPATVDEETWLRANAHRIEEEGAAETINLILDVFQETFPDVEPPAANDYIAQAFREPVEALYRLLDDLREAVRLHEAQGGNGNGR